jgi:hypothetical protein
MKKNRNSFINVFFGINTGSNTCQQIPVLLKNNNKLLKVLKLDKTEIISKDDIILDEHEMAMTI